jgi:surfeit locus 1 family protein
VNENSKKPLPEWLPFVVGIFLVVQFAGLGAWQISRGLDKRAEQNLYIDDSGFTNWTNGMEVRPYQRLKVEGQFDAEHQFLLENIILNSRYGYYVVTPLRVNDDNDVLLVNRGWIEKTGDEVESSLLAINASTLTVHGRAGSLPRAGYKMGEAISPGSSWPRYAVYPSLDEIAATLGHKVQPFVLLMEPEYEFGFVRHWVPEEMGAGRHFAYALQWFAMGAVLAAILIWNFRRRRSIHV